MAAATVAAEIAALPEPRGPLRRVCGDLARRVRLLAPLLDDPSSASASSTPLADALRAARDLLQSVHHGSKIYQVYSNPPSFCHHQAPTIPPFVYPIQPPPQPRRPREAETGSSASSPA
jgi:hypothetical protein